MTSDKAGQSEARERLDYAMGVKRVSVGELSGAEFDAVLHLVFNEVDLRELRGFITLKQLLSRTPGSSTTGRRRDPVEMVSFSSEAKFVEDLEPEVWKMPVGPETQMISVSRGHVGIYEATYRRYESGEETIDHTVAREWGDTFVRKVRDSILVLRRPPDNYMLSCEALYRLVYVYEKVPHKDEMLVTHVGVRRVPLGDFRTVFGEDYGRVGSSLIHELAMQHQRTLDELQSKVSQFQRRVRVLDRWNDATTA